ncbi:STAS domain-containing protein [Spongiactinospora rosea]|uniref:STAS domain-containing protein n=1 Tax=Spongiactinospora rosea TaxID=2248750 RepID=UPI0018F36A6C|nr:STAS domain-containing protein [Spongiactinospora rosea]
MSVLPGRYGIRARGVISAATRHRWEQALAVPARRRADVSCLKLSQVAFVDVAGVRALALTAIELPGRLVVVEHPPPQVPRVLQMFWPDLHEIKLVPR